MHLFGTALFLAPLLLFGGLVKVLLFVGLIVLFVRLVSGGPRRFHHAHMHGYQHAQWSGMAEDPRRTAAMRLANGQIGPEEYAAIVRALDGTMPPAA
jgi:hypothetical protein